LLQYDFLVREKIADGALISKWRKPGYEIVCSMLAIQRGNHNFGTTSHCRVPMKKRAPQQKVTPDVQTGCICCASGDGRFGGPIWWNTPMEDTEETARDNRAVWVQVGAETEDGQQDDGDGAAAGEREVEEEEDQAGPSAPSRKRPLEDDEDELDDDVKKRLAALRDS